MGYLVNLTISLIFAIIESRKILFVDHGTIGCKIKGYLRQYFYLVQKKHLSLEEQDCLLQGQAPLDQKVILP